MTATLILTEQGKRVHVGVWAVDMGSQARAGYRTGRYVPVCSKDQGVDRFRPFGPAVHRARPLCRACITRLAELSSLAASTEER